MTFSVLQVGKFYHPYRGGMETYLLDLCQELKDRVDLRILVALIEKPDCLVGNDSAPAHIAQAVGTKTVVLYGPTHDRVTGPLQRDRHSVIRNPVSCSPCYLPGRKFSCGYNSRCWDGLSAEMVVELGFRSS